MDALKRGLAPYVARQLKARYKDRWWTNGIEPSLRNAIGLDARSTKKVTDQDRLDALDAHAAALDDGLKAMVLDGLGQSGVADLPPPATPADLIVAAQREVIFLILRLRGVVDAPVIEAVRQLSPVPKLFISGASQDLEREAVRRYFAAASEPKTL
jgi:hypothetical protein